MTETQAPQAQAQAVPLAPSGPMAGLPAAGSLGQGPASPSGALVPLQRWWRGLAGRERRLLSLGTSVLLLGLVWALGVQPAWRSIRQAPAELEKLDLQLQSMRALAEETKQLRAAPTISPEQASAALKNAADRLGSKAKLTLQGDRAVLTLNALEPGQLMSWLAEVRSGARAKPLEANLTRVGGGLSGTLVLGLGAAP